MDNTERKILEALFKRIIKTDESLHTVSYHYSSVLLSEILNEINVSEDEAAYVLRGNPYIEWENKNIIKLTPLGLQIFEEEHNKDNGKPMGFPLN